MINSSPDTLSATPARESHWKILLILALLVTLAGGSMVWRVFTKTLRKTTVKQLGPGLTLSINEVELPGGTLKTFVTRMDRKKWQFRLQPAGASTLDQAPVADIVATYNQQHIRPAPLAINGGFFAYDGAAVGAVKIDGEWLRLPWKNRTVIGWQKDGTALIDNLQAQAIVRGEKVQLPIDNLNGRPTATSLTVLNRHFGPEYQLRAGEHAVLVDDGIVVAQRDSGKISLAPHDFAIVAGAQKVAQLDALPLRKRATFNVETTPQKWAEFPTILGAGPRLIKDNVVNVTQVEEEFKSDVTARGPRTAIGIDRQGNYIIFVSEGWQFEFKGITLAQLAIEMQSAGAVNAINLDGGASTTLIAEEQLMNVLPKNREVAVSNALLVVPKNAD